MMKRAITFFGAFLLILSGCGVPNTLTLEETKQAAAASDGQMRSTSSASSTAGLANLLGFGDQTITRDCPEGGTVKAGISYGVDVGGLNPLGGSQSAEVNIDYNMSLSGCVANEVTMDGDMKLVMITRVLSSSSGSTVSVELEVSGGLYYDGPRLKGSCSFDYSCTMTESTGTTGGITTTVDVYVSCSGNYCGHDIDAVFKGNLIPVSN